jgi:hypothetical protein
LQYTFTMPAYGVTVTATFRVAPHPDRQAVDEAKYVIEHADFAVAMSTANTQEGVRERLVGLINTLLAGKGVTISLNDVTVSSFTAATAGTDNAPAGVNGSFTFTITLAKGGHTASASTSGTVTVSDPSANEAMQGIASLHAVRTSDGLLLRGLVAGEAFSLYSVSGQLHYTAKATDSEQRVRLNQRGVYIVVSGNRRVKAVY